jgi:hypothetical protein
VSFHDILRRLPSLGASAISCLQCSRDEKRADEPLRPQATLSSSRRSPPSRLIPACLLRREGLIKSGARIGRIDGHGLSSP